MTYCQSITQTLRNICVKCTPLSLRSKTRQRERPLLPTWIYSCRSSVTVSCALLFYDKRDDFDFHITKFPFLSSNIPSSPAYCDLSHSLRYARACSSYECFILRAARLSSKLRGQGYVMERLKSSLRKFYGWYGDLIKHYEVSLSQMLHDILGHDHIQWHPQLIRHHTNLRTYYRTGLLPGTWSHLWFAGVRECPPWCSIVGATVTVHQFFRILHLLPILTLWPNFGGFHRTLQRVRLANRGRLLHRTPGPVPSGLAFVLMLRIFFPERVMSSDLLSFEHSQVLLVCSLWQKNYAIFHTLYLINKFKTHLFHWWTVRFYAVRKINFCI